MIGVTRRQRWQRRSDGSQRTALYRYYQCESRTNRSLCDYHTQRAAELEETVRQALLGQRDRSKSALPVAGDQAAVLAEAEAQCRRLRDKLRRLNRRLEQYMEAAANGRIDAEHLRSLSLALAGEQLAADEALTEAIGAAQRQATEAERRRLRQRSLARIREEWENLDFSHRRELLRELIDRVVVRDDGIETVLRP
jgi:hypothetical protein